MTSSLDEDLSKAQTKGISKKFVFTMITLTVIAGFMFWLLLVKGFAILVAPDEAKPTAQIVIEQGGGFVSENKVYIIGSEAVLTVSADRFESKSVPLTRSSSSNIEVVLEPSPGKLLGSVNIEDGDTSWYIDGQLAGVEQTIEHALTPGEYDILVDNPYYTPHATTVAMERGLENTLAVDLDPITGIATIESQPSGAQVFIEDQFYGETPLAIEAEGGAYAIRLAYPGYEPVNDIVEITNISDQPSRNYRMSPLQGILQVRTEPLGGLLLLNGAKQSPGEISVDAGTRHKLSYELAGYYSASETLELQPGEQREVTFKLKPEIGEVVLESTQPAMVIANNKPLGPTPLSIELQALPLNLEFVAQGYRTVKKTVTPRGNKTTKVSAEMLTEFEARRKEGRPLFVETLGIDMARFRGTTFNMGSPQTEIGRNRNEHLLRVSFDKQFWVSRHEITESQYRAFDNGRDNTSLPVTDITWLDAAMYCNWLSDNEGLAPFYQLSNGRLVGINADAKGYRLPTEAEWEWLAKKAKRAKETPFVWGSSERIPRETGNFGDQSIKGSQSMVLKTYNDGFVGKAPVGSYKPDRAGIYDLAGNVSEWVHDLYTNRVPDTSITHKDYLGASRGLQNVIKGANFRSGRIKDLRAAKRDFSETGNGTTGFRIARYN